MTTSIAIGCLVQWYEIEILSEYIDTLLDAVNEYDKDSITIDIKFSINQDLEKIDKEDRLIYILSRFDDQVNRLENFKTNLIIENDLVTIADYRREFNNYYCDKVDILVWGETDMLVPKQMFNIIHGIHSQVSSSTPKYLLTFGINKMWDSSWKVIEHPSFTCKEHSDNPNDWWGVRYVTSQQEMNRINESVTDLDIVNISPFKFNGCGLVIASEVVKAGANIPKAAFFVHEDTAFLLMLQKLFGNIPQYHAKNIYLPHNRKHLNKRAFIKGETDMDKSNIGLLRKSHHWYVKGNQFSEENCYNLFNPTYKAKTWKDVFNEDSQ